MFYPGYGYGYGYGYPYYPPPYYWNPAYQQFAAEQAEKRVEFNAQIKTRASNFTNTVNSRGLSQHYTTDGRKLDKVLQQVHDYLRFRGRSYNNYHKQAVIDSFDTLTGMVNQQQTSQAQIRILKPAKPKRDLAIALVVTGIGLGLLGFSLGAMLSMASIGLAIAGFMALFFVAPLIITGAILLVRAALSVHFERNIKQVRNFVQNPNTLNTPQPRKWFKGRHFRLPRLRLTSRARSARQNGQEQLPPGVYRLGTR